MIKKLRNQAYAPKWEQEKEKEKKIQRNHNESARDYGNSVPIGAPRTGCRYN
jgi:hypothetical protein